MNEKLSERFVGCDRDDARDAARRRVLDVPLVTVPIVANVTPILDGGCYVEALIYVPEDLLPRREKESEP